MHQLPPNNLPYLMLIKIIIKKGKAIDIDHRLTLQQYTTLFLSMGVWVVERPVVWHANKKNS